jgi:hypothetical protein
MSIVIQNRLEELSREVAELKALILEIQARYSETPRKPNGSTRTKGTVPTRDH